MRSIRMFAVALAAIAIAGAVGPAGTDGVARGEAPALNRVAVIVMENHGYRQVIGSPEAPWITRKAHRFGLARHFYAISHPSLPNYLALTGGSTFGIDSDCTDCAVRGRSIVDQLEHGHISWKGYMEDLPHPCFTGQSSGGYAKKHNPFAYYTADRAA